MCQSFSWGYMEKKVYSIKVYTDWKYITEVTVSHVGPLVLCRKRKCLLVCMYAEPNKLSICRTDSERLIITFNFSKL